MASYLVVLISIPARHALRPIQPSAPLQTLSALLNRDVEAGLSLRPLGFDRCLSHELGPGEQ